MRTSVGYKQSSVRGLGFLPLKHHGGEATAQCRHPSHVRGGLYLEASATNMYTTSTQQCVQ